MRTRVTRTPSATLALYESKLTLDGRAACGVEASRISWPEWFGPQVYTSPRRVTAAHVKPGTEPRW